MSRRQPQWSTPAHSILTSSGCENNVVPPPSFSGRSRDATTPPSESVPSRESSVASLVCLIPLLESVCVERFHRELGLCPSAQQVPRLPGVTKRKSIVARSATFQLLKTPLTLFRMQSASCFHSASHPAHS